MTTNQELLQQINVQKGAITSGTFSATLTTEQANVMIDHIINQSTVLKGVRVERMNAPFKNVDDVALGNRIARPGIGGTDPGDTTTATSTRRQLVSKEIVVAVPLGDDMLEDVPEGKSFAQHFMGMIDRQLANEVEDAVLHGRRWNGSTNPNHIRTLWNGFVTQAAVNGRVVNANAMSDRFMSLATGNNKLSSAIRALPSKYRLNPAQLRFIMHPDLAQDYVDLQMSVQNMAPAAVAGAGVATYRSIPILEAPIMSVAQVVSGTFSGGDTALAADVVADATSITVASITGFAAGDTFVIGRGLASEETVTVSGTPSGSTINLTSPLKYDHASGELVKEYTAIVQDGTPLLLTDPTNLVVGIQRDFRIETQRLPRRRALDVVVTFRADCLVINPDALVVVTNNKTRS